MEQTNPTTPLTRKSEVSYWKEQFEKCKSLREPYERDWYMNLAFYKGKQYVTWLPAAASTLSTQSLVEPRVPDYRVRLVANKVRPAMRRELTKLTREEPIFYCPPATSDPNDVAAAKAAEVIAEYLIDQYDFKTVRRRATFWAVICGSSFIRTMVFGAEAAFQYDAVTGFHLYVPFLQEEDLEKQPYVIHARAIPVDDVLKQWGVRVKPSQDMTASISEQKFLNAIGIKQGKIFENKSLAFIKEIWIKPCPKYPNGGLLIFAEDTLVYAHGMPAIDPEKPVLPNDDPTETAYPFAHVLYPFDKIDHFPSGAFYGTSAIEDLIPLQKEYNKTRSQITESKNRMAFPQMWYTKGAIDPKKMTSSPGLMVPVTPGMDGPKPIEHRPVEGYVMQELERNLSDMADITSQYETTKGGTPPGVEAASAIAYLQEENDSMLYHTVASIERATSQIGKKSLALVSEFWEFDRITEIVSKNSSFEAIMFKQSNFEKNMDIRVETGSMAPKSRAAKQAFITELMKMGLLPPEKGLRYLDMNETNRLYEELQADAKQAQRENFRMSQMQPVQLNEWDNDVVHEYEHGLFLKSQTFELIQDPAQRQMFIDHYMGHKLKVMMLNAGISDPSAGSTDESGNPIDGTQQQLPV